jgi:hypothetical protein
MEKLEWKAALLEALAEHMEKLGAVDELNDAAIEALATVYQTGFKDCLRWLVKQGVIVDG